MILRYIYLLFILIVFAFNACQSDIDDKIPLEKAKMESESFMTLTTAGADEIIKISVDAPLAVRSGVWIDLDGNGERSDDGAEDITIFNEYNKYDLKSEMRTVNIYGDITYLAAATNELKGINISSNPHLKVLNIPLNKLTSIDLSSNRSEERRVGKECRSLVSMIT